MAEKGSLQDLRPLSAVWGSQGLSDRSMSASSLAYQLPFQVENYFPNAKDERSSVFVNPRAPQPPPDSVRAKHSHTQSSNFVAEILILLIRLMDSFTVQSSN